MLETLILVDFYGQISASDVFLHLTETLQVEIRLCFPLMKVFSVCFLFCSLHWSITGSALFLDILISHITDKRFDNKGICLTLCVCVHFFCIILMTSTRKTKTCNTWCHRLKDSLRSQVWVQYFGGLIRSRSDDLMFVDLQVRLLWPLTFHQCHLHFQNYTLDTMLHFN